MRYALHERNDSAKIHHAVHLPLLTATGNLVCIPGPALAGHGAKRCGTRLHLAIHTLP